MIISNGDSTRNPTMKDLDLFLFWKIIAIFLQCLFTVCIIIYEIVITLKLLSFDFSLIFFLIVHIYLMSLSTISVIGGQANEFECKQCPIGY